MSNLFAPGVVIIPPDKELTTLPYVPGVIMAAATGAVVGAVPNTVVATSDGALLGDGTMGFNDHLTPFNFRIYDPNFNQLAANLVFSPSGVGLSPPSPCSDFVNWFYVNSRTTLAHIRRMSKAGVVDSPTWTLSTIPSAFAVDSANTWLYYFDGLGNIQSWVLATNLAGPTVLAVGSLPAHYGTGTTMRVVPATGNILAMMNFIVSSFVQHLEVWQIAGLNSVFPNPPPGTVITKTVLKGLPGNTDPTMQIDVGTPSTAFWVRSYDGPDDRADGCLFDQIRISDGSILNEWRQTIAEVDDGVPGGILPATCPLMPWTVSVSGCVPGWSSGAGTDAPGCVPSGISGRL